MALSRYIERQMIGDNIDGAYPVRRAPAPAPALLLPASSGSLALAGGAVATGYVVLCWGLCRACACLVRG
eukprot:COSAG01_NODE_251_length_20305_cov_5.846447_31_plen_70_part_00